MKRAVGVITLISVVFIGIMSQKAYSGDFLTTGLNYSAVSESEQIGVNKIVQNQDTVEDNLSEQVFVDNYASLHKNKKGIVLAMIFLNLGFVIGYVKKKTKIPFLSLN